MGDFGGNLQASPVVAALPNGNMLMAGISPNGGSLMLQRLVDQGNFFTSDGWVQESQHWQSNVAPFISVLNGVAYLLLLDSITEESGGSWTAMVVADVPV